MKAPISKVKRSLPKIEKGLKQYISLMERIHRVNVVRDKAFQRDYNAFFRLRQRPKEFYVEYYKFMERRKNDKHLTFEQVLKHLYKKLERVEVSFGSKLLSMVRPKMPVWDSKVVKNLDLKEPPHYRQADGKKYANICELDEFYKVKIHKRIDDFLCTEEAEEWIKLFDERYPEAKGISKMKKIDLILWQIREK